MFFKGDRSGTWIGYWLNIGFYSEWDSLIFWKKYNWRDFTWISLSTESSNLFHLKEGYFQLHFMLLGLGFQINVSKNDDSEV